MTATPGNAVALPPAANGRARPPDRSVIRAGTYHNTLGTWDQQSYLVTVEQYVCTLGSPAEADINLEAWCNRSKKAATV